jgi:mono/diheme cytochrome c family protein
MAPADPDTTRRFRMTLRVICSIAMLSLLAPLGILAQDKAPEGAASSSRAGGALYKVVEGTKVDEETFQGFRAWRAASCDRCHGANQEGLVGPSLIESMKTLPKEDFVKVVRDGRLDKGMQSFGNSKIVMDNIDHLYAYLKGRSDGAITQAKVSKIDE